MPLTATTWPSLIQDESIKAEIRSSIAQSASAFNRGDIEAILLAYAPDAVVLPPNNPAVRGLPGIRQLWKTLLAAGYCNAVFAVGQIEHWGDVAIAVGRYTVQVPVKPGTSEVDRGKFVGHWRRMEDGKFRVTASVWSSDRWHSFDHS
jgi:ketosteroid isomerase-like protein